MSLSRSMSAFELYLRTGRRPREADASVELKFNPWHDPTTGRFTSAQGGTSGAGRRPDGSWDGGGFTGGGGGSSGGAGATGRFGWSVPKRVTGRPATAPKPSLIVVQRQRGADKAPAIGDDRMVIKNGYRFRIDAAERTREVTGTITLGHSEPRSRSAQAAAGGADRLRTDEGGHYIAARFNGPNDAFNHFAQDRNFNRGQYRVYEQSWARSVAAGHRVKVDIGPVYAGDSGRPIGLYLSVDDNGRVSSRYLGNHRHGR